MGSEVRGSARGRSDRQETGTRQRRIVLGTDVRVDKPEPDWHQLDRLERRPLPLVLMRES